MVLVQRQGTFLKSKGCTGLGGIHVVNFKAWQSHDERQCRKTISKEEEARLS
jgi:hypothetical protein